MPMNKPHLEFHKIDMDSGWATPPGYPAGIKQKILASDLDETRKMGGRTRLLKFDPGVSPEAAQKFREKLEAGHTGPQAGFKTLYLGAGADVKVVGFCHRHLRQRPSID